MKYLAILGRQPEISLAELEALGWTASPAPCFLSHGTLSAQAPASSVGTLPQGSPAVHIDRLGGTLKLAEELKEKPIEFLQKLPEGKITLGVSDYSVKASRKTATMEALKLKKILVRHGRSVRVVENKDAILSTATSLHNGLSGRNERKVELIKTDNEWYKVIGIQDIDAYSKRDQVRPARDAKVGMLPPKLAQILINLCGPLKSGATILDPFCGTGVVLQEALLMGYRVYGTDISERMVEYSKKNLEWLLCEHGDQRGACSSEPRNDGREREREQSNLFQIVAGDATSFTWTQPIDAVACEGYLGRPMSQVPLEIKLKTEKQECKTIIMGFLKNLSTQIKSGTPVVMAIPAWLRENGNYSRLEILDEIERLGYNVNNKSREGLLYARAGQIVARDIIISRKK